MCFAARAGKANYNLEISDQGTENLSDEAWPKSHRVSLDLNLRLHLRIAESIIFMFVKACDPSKSKSLASYTATEPGIPQRQVRIGR